LSVVQALPHQQVAVEQPVRHRVVVLHPITICRFDPLTRYSSILERDGVGGQDCDASPSERGPEGLMRIAHIAGYFAFPEMELAVVLMEDDHSAERLPIRWHEQESRNDITFQPQILEPFSAKPVGFLAVAPSEVHPDWVRQRQARSQCRG
jgi:hypothetical protein